MEFFHKKTSFPFMATRKVWYTLSAVLMIGCFASFLTRGLNFAIDFTGGISVAEVPFRVMPRSSRCAAPWCRRVSRSVRSTFGSERDMLVRLPPDSKLSSAEIRAKVDAALKRVDARAELRRFEVIGPQVGGELRTSAAWALTFTLIGIGIYVALRFHTWRLSLGAIIAVMHDPILVLGYFSVTHTPFDLAVVAATLAVIGYSLNDTVVVFDRIRERFHASRRLPPQKCSMTRSIKRCRGPS